MLYRRFIIHPTDDYYEDVNARAKTPGASRPWLHILLFVITVFTTTAVGALNQGFNPVTPEGLLAGLPFSATILAILGVHEFAHYFAAKHWGIVATLPFFIPAPLPPIGTFGAVIKMKSSIPSRKALVDVGVSGPLAGFIVSVIACIVGLKLSTILPLDAAASDSYSLGEPLLFKLVSRLVLGLSTDEVLVMLHPVAFAGWIGLFVTALNLLPIGQLDGGHILFAVSPKIHELVRRIRIPLLVLMGITFWEGWYVWAVLSLFFGRHHPYPDTMESSLGRWRTILVAVALLMFIVSIMPTPIAVGNP